MYVDKWAIFLMSSKSERILYGLGYGLWDVTGGMLQPSSYVESLHINYVLQWSQVQLVYPMHGYTNCAKPTCITNPMLMTCLVPGSCMG